MVTSNSIFCPVAFMGTIMAVAIYCTADPFYDESDLARTIEHLEPRIILVATDLVATVTKALTIAKYLSARPYLFSDDVHLTVSHSMKSWWSIFAGEKEELPDVFPDAGSEEVEEIVAIVYSSGTTGMLKGVIISHRNYIAAALGHMKRLQEGIPAEEPSWRVLGALSMHHVLGQRIYGAIFPLLSMPIYITAVQDYREILGLLEALEINFTVLRSSAVRCIGKDQSVAREYDLKSLVRIEPCATKLEQSVRVATEEALRVSSPLVQVTGIWGLTEAGHIAGWDLGEPCTNDSVGRLHANYQGRIVLPDGCVAKTPGTVGEI
jgi:4-coumarate--CoA ligase